MNKSTTELDINNIIFFTFNFLPLYIFLQNDQTFLTLFMQHFTSDF